MSAFLITKPRVLICWLMVFLACDVAAQGPPSQAVICLMDAWLPVSTYGYFAATRTFPAQYPKTQWIVRVLPSNFNARTTVRAFVVNGTDCAILLGCVSSTPTIALSPLVDASVAWIDSGATSNELSDKSSHPYFNRAIPTDAIGAEGAATAAYRLGWRSVNVLCENIAYGRSVSEAFSSSFANLGGTVAATRCFESGASEADVELKIAQIRSASPSRILFVASAPSELAESGPYKVLQRLALAKEMVLMFCEGACTESVMKLYPGAICATYIPNPELQAAFDREYASRDLNVDMAVFTAVGRTTQEVTAARDLRYIYSSFIVDTVRHAMQAVTTYVGDNRTQYPNIAVFMRSFTTEGLTGTLKLKANGDRNSAPMALYNTQRNPATDKLNMVPAGIVTGDQYTASPLVPVTGSTDLTTYTPSARYYWFDKGYAATAPVDIVPAPPKDPGLPTYAVPIIVILAAVLVIVLVVSYMRYSKWRVLARCPTDDTQPYTVMFVGVKNEAQIRDICEPASVARALKHVAQVVRREAATAGCHEARRVSEGTFLLVSKSPAQCLACAASVARTLNTKTDWSSMLVAATVVEPHHRPVSRDHTARRSQAPVSARRGSMAPSARNSPRPNTNHSEVSVPDLRVNIGIAHGMGNIDHDEERGMVSFHGAIVNIAAQVADCAVGGQIAVTEPIVDALQMQADRVADTFDEYRTLDITDFTAQSSTATPKLKHSKRDPITVVLYTYMIGNYPVQSEVDELLRRQMDSANFMPSGVFSLSPRSGDTSVALTGSISSAYTRAECGISMRRVAVVCIDVPAFIDSEARSAGEHARTVTRQLEEIIRIARLHKGHFHEVVGSRVYITINAVGQSSVAAPSLRACHIALEVLAYFEGIDEYRCGASAGVASGTAWGGTVGETAVVLTNAIDWAALAQRAARHANVGCVATDGAFDDIISKFHVVTIDVAALRFRKVERPKAFASSQTSDNVANDMRASRMIAVLSERAADADGEWLYLFDNNEGSAETRWAAVIRGEPAPDIATAPMAPAERSPQATNLTVEQEQAAHENQRLKAHARKQLDVVATAESIGEYAYERTRQLLNDYA
jgi:class 3 adenylate cyclase